MELFLRDLRLRSQHFVLLDEAVRVEEKWGPLRYCGEFRYEDLSRRSVKPKRFPITWFIVFVVLSALPVAFAYFASLLPDARLHIGTALFGIPALLAFREFLLSFCRELLFLEETDGGVALRFRYHTHEEQRVEAFAKELRRRIADKKTK